MRDELWSLDMIVECLSLLLTAASCFSRGRYAAVGSGFCEYQGGRERIKLGEV